MTKDNDPTRFHLLSKEKQDAAIAWCKEVLSPAKTVTEDSNAVKDRYEHCSKVYMSNGEFAGALLAAGFEKAKVNFEAKSHHFKVKYKDPRHFDKVHGHIFQLPNGKWRRKH